MAAISPHGVLVIGLGDGTRSDAAAGRIAARRLREAQLHGIRVQEIDREGARLIDLWNSASFVVLLGAIYSSDPPGTIHRLDARARTIPQQFFSGSARALDLADTLELARAFNRLPPRLILFGIVGQSFVGGVGLSPAVEAAVPAVIEQVCREISCPAPLRLEVDSDASAGGYLRVDQGKPYDARQRNGSGCLTP
jgi:hydrogenase maturation protease